MLYLNDWKKSLLRNWRSNQVHPTIIAFCILNPTAFHNPGWTKVNDVLNNSDEKEIDITSDCVMTPILLDNLGGADGPAYFNFLCDIFTKSATSYILERKGSKAESEEVLLLDIEHILYILKHICLTETKLPATCPPEIINLASYFEIEVKYYFNDLYFWFLDSINSVEFKLERNYLLSWLDESSVFYCKSLRRAITLRKKKEWIKKILNLTSWMTKNNDKS